MLLATYNESICEIIIEFRNEKISTWKNTEIGCIKPDWCVHAFCGLAVILVDKRYKGLAES
jgi:hypothetical protein